MSLEPYNRQEQVLVSACCLGLACRYHGRKAVLKARVARLLDRFFLVPVCPELLGGLPTPRPAACWMNGKLTFIRKPRRYHWDLLQLSLPNMSDLGEAYPFFLRGAEETARIAEVLGIRKAYFLKGSPSCDPKKGVCSQYLRKRGLKVFAL